MLFSGCSANRLTPAVWQWKRHHSERSLRAPKRSFITLAQMRRAARSLAISSRKSLWMSKKNDSLRRETVDVEAGVDGRLHVLDAVGQGERQLLQRRRAGFADVVAADRNGIPARHVLSAVVEGIDDQLGARPRREDVLLLGDVLLEDVVLGRARTVCRAGCRDSRR